MRKMQQLRQAMKRGKGPDTAEVIRNIIGGQLTAEESKPPPEFASLKKEVRAKQNEVRALRKRWWTDHKDMDLLAEKVKHHMGEAHASEDPGHEKDKPPTAWQKAEGQYDPEPGSPRPLEGDTRKLPKMQLAAEPMQELSASRAGPPEAPTRGLNNKGKGASNQWNTRGN